MWLVISDLKRSTMKFHFLCFLLLTSFIGVISEKRLVYRDSYVILFENVIADNREKDVSLYINGAKQPSLIVIFRFGNGAITAEWRMDNYTKIFIDANRNIRIANIDKSYEGKYYIQSSGRREVELTISNNLTDEVEKIAKSLNDKQEVILKSLGNVADKIEKITKRLDDDHCGNVTDKIEKITKRLDDDHCGSWTLIFAILVIVIVLLGASLPVHIPVVWKMLKTGWFRCRKYVKTSKRNGIHQTEVKYHQVPTKQLADSALKKSKGTDLLLARVDDTDSEVMNISGGTDPDLPKGADSHSPRLPPTDMNIPGETTPLSSENQASNSASNKLSVETNPHLPKEDAHHLPRPLPTPMNIPGSEADFLTTAQGKKKIHIREKETKF